MQIKKFNLFNQIHKGLRALMFETALKSQQADFTDEQQSSEIFEQIELLLTLMHEHAHHEDVCILTEARVHHQKVIEDFEKDHHEDQELADLLKVSIRECKNSTPELAHHAGNKLLFRLNDFIAFNLEHMNREEEILNNLLWETYNGAKIMDIQHNIQQMIPANKTFIYFKWMIKGLNDFEITSWLQAVKNDAPEFVFKALEGECIKILPKNRWQKIHDSQSLVS